MQIVCSIGFFDGVHRGHQWLIQQVKDEARRRDAHSLLITFDRHPRSVFAPESAPQLLTSSEEKMALLRATGVDDIYILPFDRAMASLTAREFMQQVLKERLGVTALVIGYDHHFGCPMGEGFTDYQAYGRQLGIDVILASELPGEHISSSAIRHALEAGDVRTASQLLGRPYSWTGRVVHGHSVGRQLGFPTANLEATEPNQLRPANGAYAVKVTLSPALPRLEETLPSLTGGVGGGSLPAMLNIGHRPTLDNGSDISIEAHLFDFSGDLYGKELTVSFIDRLRPERRFTDEAELTRQLAQDQAAAIKKLEDTSY